MKKLFTILALLMAFTVSGVAQEQDTWTVAGSAAALNGNASWDLSNTQNEMSSDDGVNYTLIVTNCTLEVGTTYEFKVVKGHSSWDEAYPSSNKSFTVNETAVYTVVYTFNATTHEVGNPTTTKTGEAGVITHTYTVAGEPAALFGEEWKPEKADNDMTLSSGLYTWTKNDVELVDDLSIAFKICVDHAWGTSYPSGNFVVNKNTGLGYDGAGTYDVTITFNESTKEVNATFVKQVENAEITSVQIFGSWDNWDSGFPIDLEAIESNTYVGGIDIPSAKAEEFKLLVNGSTWLGYDQVTLAGEYDFVSEGSNNNFKLSEAYISYGIRATWTPGPDASAGWTLTIDPEEARPKTTFTATFVNGAGWENVYAYIWKAGVDNNVELNGPFPGVQLEKTGTTTINTVEYDVYTFTFETYEDESTVPEMIIFSDGTDTNKTEDLEFVNEKEYTETVPDEDYYVIGNNGTEWVALGKMDYFADMEEYIYQLDNTWKGKYFAIAPASALNADGSVADWEKVVRPKTGSGNFLVELRNYYDDVVTGGENVWEKTDEITRLSIHYYIDVQDFALYPESDVTISDAGYATYSNKYDYFIFDAKVSIVKNVEGNEAVLEELEFLDGVNKGISGGTGVILEKVLAETDVVTIYPYEKYADNEYVDVTGNMLIGSGNYTYDISGTYPDGGNYTAYIFAKPEGKEVGFYLLDTTLGATLAAHKAFLAVPGASSAPFLGFGEGEGTTGIGLTPTLSQGEGAYYTLDGRRVEKPTKGLYIVNGKKVLVP